VTPTGPSPIVSAAAPIPIGGYPNVMAGWVGTLTISSVYSDGGRESTTCTHTWAISAQSNGRFSGTFQSGPAGACVELGTLTGNVSTTGVISELTVNAATGDDPFCTRSSGDTYYSGQVSPTTLTARRSDEMRCSFPANSLPGAVVRSPLTLTADRTLSFSMTRR
jgi:hypothetical protein